MTNIQTIKETQELLAAQISHLQKRLKKNTELRRHELKRDPDYLKTEEYYVLIQAAQTLRDQINAYTNALYALKDLREDLSK